MKNLYDESIMWGTHASVKNIDNKICQKVYEEYTMTTIKDHVIDEWVFNTIKSLDLESLVKLYDYVFNTIRGQITSYTMEYYEPFIEDILNIDTYYIIDSFIKIYRDVIILSENSILIGDMNFSNIIFGKNGIKVIDFDNYKKSTLSRNKLIELKDEQIVSFHIPGHKSGKIFKKLGYDKFLDKIYTLDTTEIEGTDNLHNAKERK